MKSFVLTPGGQLNGSPTWWCKVKREVFHRCFHQRRNSLCANELFGEIILGADCLCGEERKNRPVGKELFVRLTNVFTTLTHWQTSSYAGW